MSTNVYSIHLCIGFLGQLTQTADVTECPGKCIHAIASLICDEVKEDVQCPSRSMRCCVERDSRPPLKQSNNENTTPASTTPETTTKKRIKKKKPTTITTTTPRSTTSRVTTTSLHTQGRTALIMFSSPIALQNDNVDKFGGDDTDYEYTDSNDSSGTFSPSNIPSRFKPYSPYPRPITSSSPSPPVFSHPSSITIDTTTTTTSSSTTDRATYTVSVTAAATSTTYISSSQFLLLLVLSHVIPVALGRRVARLD